MVITFFLTLGTSEFSLIPWTPLRVDRGILPVGPTKSLTNFAGFSQRVAKNCTLYQDRILAQSSMACIAGEGEAHKLGTHFASFLGGRLGWSLQIKAQNFKQKKWSFWVPGIYIYSFIFAYHIGCEVSLHLINGFYSNYWSPTLDGKPHRRLNEQKRKGVSLKIIWKISQEKNTSILIKSPSLWYLHKHLQICLWVVGILPQKWRLGSKLLYQKELVDWTYQYRS